MKSQKKHQNVVDAIEWRLAQARELQCADGFIPTFWSDHPHVVHDNWVNCMLYTAETLAELRHFFCEFQAPEKDPY